VRYIVLHTENSFVSWPTVFLSFVLFLHSALEARILATMARLAQEDALKRAGHTAVALKRQYLSAQLLQCESVICVKDTQRQLEDLGDSEGSSRSKVDSGTQQSNMESAKKYNGLEPEFYKSRRNCDGCDLGG
jgi:hypothetical protein